MSPEARHTHSGLLKPNYVIFIRSPARGPASFYNGAPGARQQHDPKQAHAATSTTALGPAGA
jgi:hypothetical protein